MSINIILTSFSGKIKLLSTDSASGAEKVGAREAEIPKGVN